MSTIQWSELKGKSSRRKNIVIPVKELVCLICKGLLQMSKKNKYLNRKLGIAISRQFTKKVINK